eukprot:jgi/Pico_ML_1/54305/g4673.t1
MQLRLFAAPAIMMGLRALKIDLKEHVMVTWVALVVGVALSLGVCLAIYARVARLRNAEVANSAPKSVKVGKGEAEEQITPGEHDARSLKKLVTGVFTGCAFAVALGHFFKVQQPILLQAFMQPITVLTHPLFKLHVRGKAAEGDLARPFKEDANPFESLTKPAEPEPQTAPAVEQNNGEGSETKDEAEKKDD